MKCKLLSSRFTKVAYLASIIMFVVLGGSLSATQVLPEHDAEMKTSVANTERDIVPRCFESTYHSTKLSFRR
jgi:hypothetical protein